MFIEYLPPSPRAGIKEHVRRESAEALILAGFAKAVTDPSLKAQPAEPSLIHTIPPMPERGWVVGYKLVKDVRTPCIILHDGAGGQQAWSGVPAPRPVWNGAEQKYVLTPYDVPSAVLAQFHELVGNAKAGEEARERGRQEVKRAKELAQQNKEQHPEAAIIARLSH